MDLSIPSFHRHTTLTTSVSKSTLNPMQSLLEEIKTITPWDETETSHLNDCLDWMKSGAPIFRIKKPATPNKHLVSYSVLVDPAAREVLLVEHKNALLWLPCGGHVEVDEHPKVTAEREIHEELGIEPKLLFDKPIFITNTVTVGLDAGHTDVSLWYVFAGQCDSTFNFDRDEFHSVRWFPFDEIPFDKCDPHMARFIGKLEEKMARSDGFEPPTT